MEGVLLAAIGGALGAALAAASFDALVAAYPLTLPRASEVHMDFRVAAAALLGSLGIGLAIGVLPAIRLTRLQMSDALRSGERGEGLSLNLRTQTWLVTTELAVAVAVVVGALLLAQSFIALQRVPLGFDPSGVTSTTVSLPSGTERPREEAPLIFASLTERLRGASGCRGGWSHFACSLARITAARRLHDRRPTGAAARPARLQRALRDGHARCARGIARAGRSWQEHHR